MSALLYGQTTHTHIHRPIKNIVRSQYVFQYMSVHLPFRMSLYVCLFVCILFVRILVQIYFVSLSVCLFLWLSVCLSIYLSVWLSVYVCPIVCKNVKFTHMLYEIETTEISNSLFSLVWERGYFTWDKSYLLHHIIDSFPRILKWRIISLKLISLYPC